MEDWLKNASAVVEIPQPEPIPRPAQQDELPPWLSGATVIGQAPIAPDPWAHVQAPKGTDAWFSEAMRPLSQAHKLGELDDRTFNAQFESVRHQQALDTVLRMPDEKRQAFFRQADNLLERYAHGVKTQDSALLADADKALNQLRADALKSVKPDELGPETAGAARESTLALFSLLNEKEALGAGDRREIAALIDPIRQNLKNAHGDYASLRSVGVGITQAGMSLLGGGARVAGLVSDKADAAADAIAQESKRLGQARSAEDPSFLAEAGAGIARSAAQAIATGPAAIPAQAWMAYSDALNEGREAGLSKLESQRYAATSGIIEGTITKFMPKFLGKFSKYLGGGGVEEFAGASGQVIADGFKGGLREVLKKAAGQFVGEQVEELTIEAANALNESLSGVDPNALTPEALSKRAFQTFVQTAGTLGLMGAVKVAGSESRADRLDQVKQERLDAQTERVRRQTPPLEAPGAAVGQAEGLQDIQAAQARPVEGSPQVASLEEVERGYSPNTLETRPVEAPKFASVGLSEAADAHLGAEEAAAWVGKNRETAAKLAAVAQGGQISRKAWSEAFGETNPDAFGGKREERAAFAAAMQPALRVLDLEQQLGRQPVKADLVRSLDMSREQAGRLLNSLYGQPETTSPPPPVQPAPALDLEQASLPELKAEAVRLGVPADKLKSKSRAPVRKLIEAARQRKPAAFPTAHELDLEEFDRSGVLDREVKEATEGLAPEQAARVRKVISRRAVPERGPDSTFGYIVARDDRQGVRNRFIEKAVESVKAGHEHAPTVRLLRTGGDEVGGVVMLNDRAFWLDMDQANMGGLNDFLKSEEAADVLNREMADTLKQELESMAKPQPGQESEALDAAIQRVRAKHLEIAKRYGVENLEHKSRKDPIFNGVGFIFGVTEIKPDDTVKSVKERGDADRSAKKYQGVYHGLKGNTQAARHGAPGKPAAGTGAAGVTPQVSVSQDARAGAPVPERAGQGRPASVSEVRTGKSKTKHVGGNTAIRLEGRDKPIVARYALIEADDLLASDDFRDGFPRKRSEFPQDLQPRDYSPDTENANKVLREAARLTPGELVSDTALATTGPPTLAKDGPVLAGNGRSMMAQLAAKKGVYGPVKAYLAERAEQYGFTAEQVEAMNAPVLVRVVPITHKDALAQEIARLSNVDTTNAQTVAQEAESLSRLIPQEVWDTLKAEPDASFSDIVVDENGGRAFRESLYKALPPARRARYFNKDLTLNDEGKTFAKKIILATVLPEDLAEALPVKAREGVERAAVQFRSMLSGEYPINMQPALLEALRFWKTDMREGKLTAADTLDQDVMFGDKAKISPEGRVMLDHFLKTRDAPAKFAAGIRSALTGITRDNSGLLAAEAVPMGQAVAEAFGVPVREGAFEASDQAKREANEGPEAEDSGDQAMLPPGGLDRMSYGELTELAEKVGVDAKGLKGKSRQYLREQIQNAHGNPFNIPTQAEGTPGRTISNHEIIATFEREFGVSIRSGRLPGAPAGVFKHFQEIIRLKGKYAGDLAVGSHETAHKVDKQFGISKSIPDEYKGELRSLDYEPLKARLSEGFAEYVRYWLTTDQAESKAPKFHAWFQQAWMQAHPETAAAFGKLRGLIERWRQQGAGARIQGAISRTGQPARPLDVPRLAWLKQRITEIARKTYAALKDEGHYLNLFEQEARARGLSAPAGSGPFELFKAFTQSGPSFAHTAIEHGAFKLTGNMERIGPGLREVFDEISASEYDGFTAWLVARHAREAWSKGVNPGVALQDAEHFYREKHNDRWERAADRLTDFNNALIDMLADAGVIAPWTARRIKASYKTYVPLMRVKDRVPAGKGLGGKKLVDLPSPLKRRAGSSLQVLDPIQATVERAIRFYERAAQQQVIERIVETAEKAPGLGGWVERVPPKVRSENFTFEQVQRQLEDLGVPHEALEGVAPGELLSIWKPDYLDRDGEPIGRVIRNGQTRLYQFDRDLYAAVSGMNYFQLPYFLDMVFGKATRLVKLGATGLSTAFALRNPIRDYGSFLFQTKETKGRSTVLGPAEMLGSYIYSQALKLAGREGDPLVRLWEEMGGPLSQELGLDRERIKAQVDRLTVKTPRDRVLSIAKHPVEFAREVLGVSEVGPRLAEFRGVLEKHGYTREKLRALLEVGERPPRNVLVEALNAANDVTVNFKRQGSVGKWLNRTIPFFNAGLEGTDKFVRTWRDNPKRTFLMGAALASATLLYWLMKRDEDWYEEAPPWLKYGNWVLTDGNGKPFLRLPRPFEWGWTISAGTEAILNAFDQRDPGELRRYLSEAGHTLSPRMTPSLITPLAETFFNYDLFRDRPIVPRGLENREHRDQALPHNTAFAKLLGEWLDYPPAKIEHLLEGLSGGLFKGVASKVEALAGASIGAQSFTVEDLPGLTGLSLPAEFSRSVDEFYRERERVTQERNSSKDRGHVPADLEWRYDQLNRYADLMARLRAPAKGIADRDARFDLSEKYIIGLARHALGEEALDRYPLPFEAKTESMPPSVKLHRNAFILSRLESLMTPVPTRLDKRQAYQEAVEASLNWLRTVNLPAQDLRQLAAQHVRAKYGRETAAVRLQRLNRYLQRLQPVPAQE